MISYVECLSGEGAGPGMASRCWNSSPDEELDELLPRKMAALQPKTEGSLRRRLLSAKIYQQHSAMLNVGSTGRPGTPTGDNKPLPPHLQSPANSPWYLRQHLPPRPHIHPSLPPEAHGKLFFGPEANGKANDQTPPLQLPRPSCPVLSQRYRTGSLLPTPEPRPGYTLPSPLSTKPPLKEPEVPPQYRYEPSRRRRTGLFHLRLRRGRSSRREATHTTPLLCKAGDGDRKWSVHYTTQNPQQGLLFIPGTKRRSGSAEDLQGCNGLTQHGQTSSCQPRPPSPSSYRINQSEGSTTRRRWRDKSRKMSSVFSDEDEKIILNNTRPMTPLVLNPVHGSSSWDVFAPAWEPTFDEENETTSRLPTPEEKMRQQAEAVRADIVPINVTGESFDRQASFRRTAGKTDSVTRRPRNLGRRKTVTGIPEGASRTKGSPSCSPVLPGQFSTVGRPASSCSSAHMEKKTDKEAEELGKREVRDKGHSLRRIRAPRGEGMSSLMASLTSSPLSGLRQDRSVTSGTSSEFHSLPYLSTNSSLNSQTSCNSISYRTLSASSSIGQSKDLQGFPSDFQPLLPYDPTARIIPQSPSSSSSSSFPSSPLTSSLLGTPKSPLKSEWSYPSEKPLNEMSHLSSSSQYLSDSSITHSDSQFSYQAMDDPAAQLDSECSYNGSSCNGDTWNYQVLSPSSSIQSSQSGIDWNGLAQELRSASREGWSCDPLLSSGRSTPSMADSNSVCSERSSPLLNQDRRKFSTSSHTSTRSISLRKSKRPPAPPLRSDSLRRRSGRVKPPRSSCRSPCVEGNSKSTLSSCPQAFHDPWVPRSSTKRRQSGLNCGTVSTFEPLPQDCQTTSSSESLPFQQEQARPGEVQGQDLTTGSMEAVQASAPSVVRFHRLASPSSGYSSQSNTPTPGTPVSSPLSPSSPLTASSGSFVHSPTSPLAPVCPSFSTPTAVSSMPRVRSQGEGRPKPPIPERRSSLSSSFSSMSSLSSLTSSDSSAKHPLLPAPPPPPPLPQPRPSWSIHPTAATSPAPSALPPAPPPPPPPPLPPASIPTPPPLPQLSSRPPPPPYSYAIRQRSQHALLPSKSSSISSQTSSTSQPLSPLQSRSEVPMIPNEVPSPPPPPHPPSLPPPPKSPSSPLYLLGVSKSPSLSVRSSTPPCPLVTAQALQGVRLRSVKNQDGLPTAASADAVLQSQTDTVSANANHANSIHLPPSKDAHPDSADANPDSQDLIKGKLPGTGAQNCVSNEAIRKDQLKAKASIYSTVNVDAKQSGSTPEQDYYNLTNTEARAPDRELSSTILQDLQGVALRANHKGLGANLSNGEVPQEMFYKEQKMEVLETYPKPKSSPVSSPDGPWVKMSTNAYVNICDPKIKHEALQQLVTERIFEDPEKAANKQGSTEDVSQTESSYWTLSGTKPRRGKPSRDKHAMRTNEKTPEIQLHSTAGEDSVARNDLKKNHRVQSTGSLKTGNPKTLRSPEKPVLPKKPDLCILSLMASPEARRGQGDRVLPSGLNNQSLVPNGSPSNAPQTINGVVKITAPDKSVTHSLPPHPVNVSNWPSDISSPYSSLSSPQRQKPTILNKKPDLMMSSPKTTKPPRSSKNRAEVSRSTSETPGSSETSGVSQIQRSSGIMETTVAEKTFNGTSQSLDTVQTRTISGPMSIYRNLSPSEIMEITSEKTFNAPPGPNSVQTCSSSETMGIYGSYGPSGIISFAESCCRSSLDAPDGSPLDSFSLLGSWNTMQARSSSETMGLYGNHGPSGITSAAEPCSKSVPGGVSPFESRGSSGPWEPMQTRTGLGSMGVYENQNPSGIMGTAELCRKVAPNTTEGKMGYRAPPESWCPMQTRSSQGTMGIYGNCGPSGMNDTADLCRKLTSNTTDRRTSPLESCGSSETWDTSNTLENLTAHGLTSTKTGAADLHAAISRTRPHRSNEKTLPQRTMRSSLAEDEEKNVRDDEGEMKTMMRSSTSSRRDKARKRRKRRAGRQLLIMSSAIEPSPSSSSTPSSSSSSSSSSSPSSGDEQVLTKDRTMQMRQTARTMEDRHGFSSDSETSCPLIGHKLPLRGAVSSDSLQGELPLPELLIQEPEEEEKEETLRDGAVVMENGRPKDADVFVQVSADQMLVSSGQRTTDDLFAVIHRSKRKLLGRKPPEDDRRCSSSSSSSSSPPVSPTDPLPCLTRPFTLRGQRSARSESFKALLLRKGSRFEVSSRLSAVERLRVDATSRSDFRSVMSLPLPPPPPPPPEEPEQEPAGPTSDPCDMKTHLTLDVPVSPSSPCAPDFSVMFTWSQNPLLLNPASSPFFFLSSYSLRPRSRTPPCSSGRRFAARCRLYAAPMTAIFEEESEEEGDNEVFLEDPGSGAGESQRLLEAS